MEIREKLQEELRKYETELEATEDRCSQLRWQIKFIKDLLDGSAVIRSEPVQTSAPTLTSVQHVGRTVPQAVTAVLHEAGGPLHIREIAKRAIAGGFGGPHANIKKLVPQIASMMGKDRRRGMNRYVKLDKGLYDLSERHPDYAVGRVRL